MNDPLNPIDRFIQRWQASGASERANYQLFLTELCAVLDTPRPDPATADNRDNAYVFERAVTFHHGDGSASTGFIDLYRRGAFVLEAKQGAGSEAAQPLVLGATNKRKQGTAKRGTASWDSAMLRARAQAEAYARALPAAEGRPPFVVVVDVGHSIELYSEFSQSGGAYVPFPDPRNHRILLTDLRNETHRDTLRQVWLTPLALDPARRAARVTREIAAKLARLAQSLERAGHAPDQVAAFLMRCLFTLFAEDVGLLGKNSFTELLNSLRDAPQHFPHLARELWQAMNHGGFSTAIRAEVLRFNGGLFADPTALALSREQLELLIEAARADWRQVEPAIFGTLLERALNPVERHKLGAHYTPRAYVERLVTPTVIEPLRAEWQAAQAAALTLDRQGKRKDAVQQLRDFHRRLCQVRVLDPACGSGNFLYVTLEHLKRLEGEVLNTLEELGETQSLLELAGVTVDPHQMRGLETNPRAAKIAEAVLWIGYLQWHYRTRGNVNPPEPVLKDFQNIECRDAVLAWDRVEFATDEAGLPITRWDGRTYKRHPVTGEEVPDDTVRTPLERYVNPRKAEWPEADFVVGNPPFLGKGERMRQALGDGYVEALRETYAEVPESADYVMFWWQKAAELTRAEKLRRFGFITTNSLRQTFNRRVLQTHLDAKNPLSLRFAIPDHPWVDAADGAAVRIAMTVAEAGQHEGALLTVTDEQEGEGEGVEVNLNPRNGKIFADLAIGANVAGAVPLAANQNISSNGMMLAGSGFIVTPEQAETLGLSHIVGLEQHIRHYRNGRDITQNPRGAMVIDLFGLTTEQVRERFPALYQWVLERVKPDRDQNNRQRLREVWWYFAEPRKALRGYLVGLGRYIATVETAKHRFFVFLDDSILPDHMLIAIALDDAYFHGVLSSRIHVCWALAAGGRLGVGNDPRYNKTRCFETFPFPNASDAQKARIRELAEQLDAYRKRQQAQHPDLTMTGMYNVLEKLRVGEELTAKDKSIHEQGLVSVLKQIHDELDAAVFDAYGWADLLPSPSGRGAGGEGRDEQILERLVALNAERAAEEKQGIIRWLRPAFQNPTGRQATQTDIDIDIDIEAAAVEVKAIKQPWPKTLAEQAQAVRGMLTGAPANTAEIARQFERAKPERVAELLETLAALGQARILEDGRFTIG